MSDAKGIPPADLRADVVVIGGGPGGYTAAFRAADLGKQVTLVDRNATLGGVCLNVGCIPSKALLHTAKVIGEAAELRGVKFSKPEIDLAALRAWKDGIVMRLTKGLATLARQRNVTVIQARAQFASSHALRLDTPDGVRMLKFDQAIIAAGSSVATVPGFPYGDPRLIDSSGALELRDVPQQLLIVGGGIIGLEMATVYHALGSRVSVVEMTDQLVPGADADLVKPLASRLAQRCEAVLLRTRVSKLEAKPDGLVASFAGEEAPPPQRYDKVLVAVGRRPNGALLNAQAAGVRVDERGFIPVDSRMRTNVPHIYAIGDIVGDPMLAHKASHEGKLAAEVIAGHPVQFQALTIPSVAYTDPEIAWAGITETQARERKLDVETAVFPWAASGRALSIGRDEGLTKLIIDRASRRVLGVGVVGAGAGELIAQAVFAIEMNAEAGDLALAIHPHPTLSETIAMAAEMAEGCITDLFVPRQENRSKKAAAQSIA